MDRIYRRLKARNGGKGMPEHKLPLMMVGVWLFALGLIMYGWTAEKHVHWIVPDIGATIFSCGNMLCFLTIQNVRIMFRPNPPP